MDQIAPGTLAALTPDPKNRRRHNPRNVGMVADALQAVGAARSIVIDEDNVILAGNGVVEAAAQVGITRLRVVETDGSELVAVRRRGLTAAQKRQLAIADNRTAELADWNVEQLAADLKNGEDLSAFFFPDELEKLLGVDAVAAGQTEPDAVPRVRETDIVVGDAFTLGRHRLICGDAREAQVIARLLDGETPTVLLTDPPYGMKLDTDWSGISGSLKAMAKKTRGSTYEPVIGDDEPFDPAHLFETFARCREIFLWGADYYAERIPDRASGSWLVWDKRKESQADGIGSEFELCWSRVRHKRRMLRHDWFSFLSSENTSDVRHRVHPTQKPVSLFVDMLQQWGEPDDLVVDVYGGSGSTLIACEQLGRACRMTELAPSYCQVIIDRWEEFTGAQAQKVVGA